MRFIQSLKLAGLLSFPPDMEPFELESLNVLIGPNGSGKSNLIETFELLRALPTDLSAALRQGGGVSEWLWKGDVPARGAQVELTACAPLYVVSETNGAIDYFIGLYDNYGKARIFPEIFSKSGSSKGDEQEEIYYIYDRGGIRIRERTKGEIFF